MHDPFKSPERVSEDPNEIRHVGYQFSQFSALKMNTRSKHIQNFESDSHGVAHGGPCVQGPPWEVSKDSYDIGHVGCQFYSVFCTEN